MTILEICVEGFSGAQAAAEGGADRVELCDRLDLGGTTPDLADLRKTLQLGLPEGVAVMIRPRGGDFVYSPAEVEEMCRQAHRVADLVEESRMNPALVQLVTGALLPSGELDEDTLHRVQQAGRGLAMVCHRAFDETPDLVSSLNKLEELGYARVLTAGGPGAQAQTGVQKNLMEQAVGVRILVCGGVRPHNLVQVVTESGAPQVHMRAPYSDGKTGTDRAVVAQAKTILQDLELS